MLPAIIYRYIMIYISFQRKLCSVGEGVGLTALCTSRSMLQPAVLDVPVDIDNEWPHGSLLLSTTESPAEAEARKKRKERTSMWARPPIQESSQDAVRPRQIPLMRLCVHV